MNNKTNYTLVGLFVVVAFISISIFAYWMIHPKNEVETKKYIIYFNESVIGLNLNSPVKFRGIDVGKVIKIGINPKNTEQVKVIISVDKTTPIKVDTAAKLTSQGITGLSYINLSLGSKTSPLLEKPQNGEKYPVIKSVPSFFESFQTSLGNMYNKFSQTLNNVDRLLDKRNQEQLSKLLTQSAIFMNKLNQTLDDETIKNLQSNIKNLDEITKQIDKAVLPRVDYLVEKTIKWEKGVDEALKSIAVSYLDIQKSMADIGDAFARGDFNIRDMSSEFLPELNRNLIEINKLLSELHSAVIKYKNSPRDMFVKSSEIKKAPGE